MRWYLNNNNEIRYIVIINKNGTIQGLQYYSKGIHWELFQDQIIKSFVFLTRSHALLSFLLPLKEFKDTLVYTHFKDIWDKLKKEL